jgi:hypothetical protein
VSPAKYELGFYIPEDDVLRSSWNARDMLHPVITAVGYAPCGWSINGLRVSTANASSSSSSSSDQSH